MGGTARGQTGVIFGAAAFVDAQRGGWRTRIQRAFAAWRVAAWLLLALLAPWRIAAAADTLSAQDRAAIAAELAKSGHAVLAGLTEARISNPAVGLGSDGQSTDQFGAVVAVSGDTAVIGAPADSIGANASQGSAYVFVRAGTAWSLQAKLTAADGAANDAYGASVAISGSTIVVGASTHSAHGNSRDGAAYVYALSGTTWALQQTLSTSDGGACGGGGFGTAVALSGNTALVGEPRNCTLQYGVAHVFVRSGSAWSEQAALHASDAVGGNYFGNALALDGDIAVVGAYQWYNGTTGYPGSAYVFARSGTTWTQQAQLFSDDNEINAYFGVSVGVSGTTVVVAAPFKTIGSNSGQGAAYVYVQSGSSWPLQQKITTTDGAANSYFGNYQGNGIALSADTLAVGAQNGVSGIGGARSYIFTRSAGAWTQRKIVRGGAGNAQIGSAGIALDNGTLVAGGPSNPACGNAFVQTGSGASWNAQATLDRGCSPTYPNGGYGTYGFASWVAVDGDTAVVSDPYGYLVAGGYDPRVFVFVRQTTGWVLQQQLVPTDGTTNNYGFSLAISGDRIAVASPSHANPDGSTGAVYVFHRSGTTWAQEVELTNISAPAGNTNALAMTADTLLAGGSAGGGIGNAQVFVRSGTTWTQQATLTASDGSSGAGFGNAVALNGNTAVIGAYTDTVGGHASQGSAYVFTRSGTTWTQQQKLTAADGAAGDQFGVSVSVSGDTAAVGASQHTVGSGTAGQAYVWLRSGTTWALQATLAGAGTAQYGASVAIDGDTLAVGAPYGDQYLSYGGVYVYWRSGTAWTQHDELNNPDITTGATSDYFGQSVSVSGGLTFIGAPGAAGLAPYGNPGDGAAFSYAYVEATTTTITGITPEPSHVGSAATVNVTVNAERVAPTIGTVAVTASSGETCTISTLSGGSGSTMSTGSCTITFTTLGARTLTASYSGAATYDPSTSSAVSHSVDKAPTTLAISSDTPDPSVVGQPYAVTVALGGAYQPSGSIAVSDGAATCSIALPAMSCNLTSTTAGAKTVTATYAGDALNLGSNASTSHTVNKAATASAITAETPDPTVVGQPYTVTVAVSAIAPGAGTPSGTISVTDGAATCSITLPAASCSLTSTTTGTKTLVATYAGDANFLGSTSPGVPHTVGNQATTTTITGTTPSPSVVGQAVAIAYSVTASSGTPTGNVHVSASSGESCTATVAAGTCSLTFAAAGAKTLTATYAGDSNFAGSSGSGAQTVNKGNVTVGVSATPATTVVGQSFSVSVTVGAAAPAAGTPTGTVSVSAGSATCTATLAAGTGSCSLTPNTTGTLTVSASFAGDANFNSGAGSATHVVNKGDVSVGVAETPATSVVGQSFMANVVVSAIAPAAGTPSGAVTVSAGSLTCSVTLSGGAGSCSLTPTTAGSLTLSASYAGDTNFNSGSGSHAHTVNKGATSTAITSATPNPSAVGQPYTVTVAFGVTAPGAGAPTGNIGVSDGSATCTIALPATSCSLTSTTAGSKTLVAVYAGDANFLTSTSPGVPHTVNGAATTTTITGTTPSPSVVGQAVSVAYTVTATSGTPTGNVTVTASSGETCTATVAAAACSLTFNSPGSKTLTATYAGNSNFAGSSGTGTQTVGKGSVSVTVSANPTTSVVGQPIAITTTVAATAPAAGTPTGTINVSAGSLTCSATLSGGSASCSVTPHAAGALTISAAYVGDANFNAGSGSATHTVGLATTTLAIVSDNPDPSTPGQPVSVVVALAVSAPGSGTPSGTISVGDGVDSCAVVLPATSCTLSLTTPGARTLTASYAGDANFSASTATATHQVNASADLAISLSDHTDYVQSGQPTVYTIVASNSGPQGVIGAHVHDAMPPELNGAAWTCTGAGGGTCSASGSGDIDQLVDLPVGASVTFLLTATVIEGTSETLVDQASIAAPTGIVDPNPLNNTATDTDVIVIFRDGFDGAGAAAPVTQGMEALGSGTQALHVVIDADGVDVLQALIVLADANGVERARLTQVPITSGYVQLMWLQRASDGLWSAAESRTLQAGQSAEIGWTQVPQDDGTLAIRNFVIVGD